MSISRSCLLRPLACLLGLLAAVAGTAEEAAPAPDLLIAEALARSPSLAALEARLAAAEALIRPAGALPDPMLEGMLVDAGFPRFTVGREEMSMAGLELRQGLLFPGKRRARRAAARAESATRARELEQLRRGLIVELRRLYARIFALDRERDALDSAHELLDLLASTASSRYGAGTADLEAVVKAQLSRSRLGERRDDLRAERRIDVAALGQLLDRPGGQSLGRIAALPEVVVPGEPWEDLVLANAPAVARARAALDAAAGRLQVAKLERKPNLSAAAGFASRGGLGSVVTFRLGVELPLWKGEKQQPLVRAAGLELEMAEQELRAAQAEARAETERLRARWQGAEAQVLRYREAIVPQTSVVLDAARSSYQSARGDFSTIIEDFNLWLEARVELARREADRYTVWAEIEALTAAPGAADEGARR